jgi:hypothetical protein
MELLQGLTAAGAKAGNQLYSLHAYRHGLMLCDVDLAGAYGATPFSAKADVAGFVTGAVRPAMVLR